MKKRHIYLKRTIKILTLLVAVVLVLQVSQEYLLAHFDSNKMRIEGFYLEEKDSLDVVCIGASEVYNDFSSGLAYDEYGFTSYPIAVGSNPVTLYKNQLIDVLEHQSPQVILIELNGALYKDEKKMQSGGCLHKYLDSMQMSMNKASAIRTAVPEDLQAEFFFPLIKYHGLWNDYDKSTKWIMSKIEMQKRGYSLLKGCSVRTEISKAKKGMFEDLSDDNSTKELESTAEKYLRELCEYCKDTNINNVVFARFPHRVDKSNYNRFQRSNRAGEIVEEYGFKYLNFEKNSKEIGIDLKTDYANYDHLNVYGMEKMTKYLGSYFVNELGVKPRELSEKTKQKWDICADYNKRFVEYLKEQTEMATTLDKDKDVNSAESAKIKKQYRCKKDIAEDITTLNALEKIPSQA